jgi:hypothetical protein
MTTCQSMVSTTLKVHKSPSLILLSRQNLFQPDLTWLACSYGKIFTFQDLVLLSEVLRVIVQAARNPIALQKPAGKVCKTNNNTGQKQVLYATQRTTMYQVNKHWLQYLNICSYWFREMLLKCIYNYNLKQEPTLSWNKYFNILIQWSVLLVIEWTVISRSINWSHWFLFLLRNISLSQEVLAPYTRLLANFQFSGVYSSQCCIR